MKKNILFMLLSLCSLVGTPFISASEYSSQLDLIKSEIESGKVSHERKEIMFANINYLERRILKKIKHHEERLNTCKNDLSNSQDETEEQLLLKKMESLEKKIKDLKEIHLGMELLKMKFIN